MRALFIATVAVAASLLVGCDSFPYMSLDEPICLVAEESFFAGCEADPTKQAECHESRLELVREGTAEWFNFFQEETRPVVVIVESGEEIPSGLVNSLVHLRVDKDLCKVPEGRSIPWACYHKDLYAEPDIAFTDEEHLLLRVMAHEFGHVLGLDDYVNLDGTRSIMSGGYHVRSADIDRVCEIHAECPARDLLWEGVEE